MSKVFLLGPTGMLGSEISRMFRENHLEVIEVGRNSKAQFDASRQSFAQFSKSLGITSDDNLINAIGWIPQKSSGSKRVDTKLAFALNTRLPAEISLAQNEIGFGWLQIGTDCVFDGSLGGYSEESPKTSSDLYSRSKIFSESFLDKAIHIRCSIIGPDARSASGLYSWFRSAPRGQVIYGYENHYWNGVTTTAFARLALGLLGAKFGPVVHHWVPRGVVSKYELLQLFAAGNPNESPHILPVQHATTIDRTLRTSNPSLNEKLWSIAGYDDVPTIEELVTEMVRRRSWEK